MSAIQKDDIITSEALKVIPQLTEDLAKASEQLAKLIVNTKALSQSIAGSTSIPKVKEDTEKLTQSQIELDKIQKQITVSVARNTEEYIAAKRVHNDLNVVIAQKTILGNKDAKSIDAQTASLRQLETALQKNRKTWSDLKGDQERNSVAGEALRQTIIKQQKSVDELRTSMGQHKQTVSDYREGLEGLIVTQEAMGLETGGLVTNVRTLGKAFFTLLGNPIFLGLAALAALFGAVKSSVETFFETTEDGEKIAEHQAAIWSAFGFTVRKAWAEAGKGVVDAVGGENGMAGILYTFLAQINIKWANTFLEMATKGTAFADVMHEINEKLSKDIVTKAKSELEFDKLVLESKNKVEHSDEERLALMDAAIENRKKQSDIEKALAKEQYEATIKQVALEKNSTSELVAGAMKEDSIQKQVQLTLEQKNRINEAEANIYKKETDILNEQKRLYAQRATEAIAIDTARLARLRAEQDAMESLTSSERNAQLKIDDDIIKNVYSTQEEITNAIYRASATRQTIIAEDSNKQTQNAIRTAEDRVRAIGKYKDSEIADIVKADKTLAVALAKIKIDFDSAINESDKKLKADLNTDKLSQLTKDFNLITLEEKRKTNKALEDLDTDFYKSGSSNTLSYELQRKHIVEEGNRSVLIAQSDFVKKQLEKLHLSKEQEAALLEAFSKHETDIDKIEADKRVAIAKEEHNAEIGLQNEAFKASMTIIQNLSDAKTAVIDKEISELQASTALQITLAGDNQRAKDKINADAAIKQARLEDEKKRIQYRTAVYEKELSVTQTGINGIEAVSAAYAKGGIYLAVLVAAAEALLLAEVASKPIPHYQFGTMNAKGGASIVGEAGTELVVTPKGQLQFTPSTATLMDLESGSKVYTHEETLGILARGELRDKQVIVMKADDNEGLMNKMDILIHATKQNKNVHSMVKIGATVWEVRKESESYKQMARVMALGKGF